MKELRGFRLLGGELLVATIEGSIGGQPSEEVIYLQDPIAYVQAQDAQGHPSLMPVPFVAKRLWLRLSAVVAEVEEEFIQEELKQHYRGLTGGIQIAKVMPLPTRKN